MRLKHRLRRFAHRFGFDVVRYPQHDPLALTARLLDHLEIDLVIDVGANDGEFAAEIRELGYDGDILSLEPLSAPFQRLRRRAHHDSKWQVVQVAAGASEGQALINIAGNAGQSSSFLPMLEAHREAAPHASYIGAEEVKIRTLDSMLTPADIDGRCIYLKIDVQGFEAAVIAGAMKLFSSNELRAAQLELSLTPLYEDSMTFQGGLDRMSQFGFQIAGIQPVFVDPDSGRVLQVDSVFIRSHDG